MIDTSLIQQTELTIQHINDTLKVIRQEIQRYKDRKQDKYKSNVDYAHLVHAEEFFEDSLNRAELALRNLKA